MADRPGSGPGLLLGSLVLVLFVSCASAPSGNGSLKTLSLSLIHGFQNVISPVDGDRCLMLPSCSAYAEEAIVTHGLMLGWLMTCDRLMRCGRDELTQSEVLMSGGQSYCYDPLGNNDFWWNEGHP